MDKLNIRAATIAGGLAAGLSHFLFGIVGVSTGSMMSMYRMMFGSMMGSAVPDFGFTWLVYSTAFWLIIGGVIGYLVAFFYNWAMKK